MEFEFVCSGIVNFINMKNEDHSIIEPSAILIRADDSTLPPGHGHNGHDTSPSHDDEECKREGKDHRHGGKDEPPQPDDDESKKPDNNHIPYLAFDSRLVTVNLPGAFREVPNAPPYRFYNIGEMEVVIENHAVGVPLLDSTFDHVLGTEEYWPEAQGRWNPNAVPPRGQRPKKSAVAAWMRFGPGRMSGGRLCPFKWKFTKLNGDTFSRHCAEEAIYSFEETESTQIQVTLKDLESGDELVTFIFRPVEGNRKITLFIGNNIASDMESAVRRRRPNAAAGPAGHFAFFNNIVTVGRDQMPLLPQSVGAPDSTRDETGGGGTDGGICGPKNG